MNEQDTNRPATFKECVLRNMWFKILSLTSILLIVASFVLPPTGVIDNSVLAASGELMGWGALYSVILAIERGKAVSVKHGQTEIEVRKKNDEDKIDEPME